LSKKEKCSKENRRTKEIWRMIMGSQEHKRLEPRKITRAEILIATLGNKSKKILFRLSYLTVDLKCWPFICG
jgi:hypothetical protein